MCLFAYNASWLSLCVLVKMVQLNAHFGELSP